MTQLMFGMTRGGYGTFIGYAVLLVLVWMIPVFCQHYIYRREERLGTSFYQAFRLMYRSHDSPVLHLRHFFLASIGTLSGENMFISFDFDDTGDNQANYQSDANVMSTQNVNGVNGKYCPHCGRPVAADAAFAVIAANPSIRALNVTSPSTRRQNSARPVGPRCRFCKPNTVL